MKKKIIIILIVSILIGSGLFISEVLRKEELEIMRNPSGAGSRTEQFQVEIEGEEGKDFIEVEIEEQEYEAREIGPMFEEVMEKLDEVILGENENFDRVERDLNLVNSLEGYPVQIDWELDSYKVMNIYGEIQKEKLVEEGTLVEVRGIITYLDKKVVYVRNVMIYPEQLEGMDLILYQINQAVSERESENRRDSSFTLPTEVEGRSLKWSKKKNLTGLYVIFLGVMLSVFLVYKEREEKKKIWLKRQEELTRSYPAMVSKLNMLLGTGMTIRNAWERIVDSSKGEGIVYEEMNIALMEMRGGIPEGEAYERFGKRCELTVYMKLGALLSQNLRKGSKGISDILKVEAIQAFENRKSLAKQRGEEAGTKLLMPMMGMLAVVLIMVMVPAFLTMEL